MCRRAVPVSTTAPVKSATKAELGAAASWLAVPSWMTRPRSMTPTRSPSCAASAKSCVTRSAGASLSRSRAPSSRAASARVRASSADSGSSSSSTSGRRASARATATRWRSPPLSVRGRASARSARPNRSSRSSARARRSGARHPAKRIRHVLPGAQVREQRVVLEDVAAAAPLRGHVDVALGVEPGGAVRVHSAVRRPQQPGGHAQDARLPRARRPGERQAASALDRQLHVQLQVAAPGPRLDPQHPGITRPASRRSASPRCTSFTDSRIAPDTATSTADSASAESKSVEKRS